jgi:hypothetical protein
MEEVIEEHGHYLVVRKQAGEAVVMAVVEDPRA